MGRFNLYREQLVPKEIEEVFSFYQDASNLQKLTPKHLDFRFITKLPIDMKAGTTIDYSIRLFGLPMRWRTLIESFDPPNSFSDSQQKGPYKYWLHIHEFERVDGGTRVIDRVTYELPFWFIGRIAHTVFVRRTLEGIFDFRAKKIEEIFGVLQRPLE
ncbi:MAG: hypothetical protein Kow00107_03730 [Planctomycetota bacterium]